MLKMNTSLEGKAGLNLQKQKAIKTQIKIWDNNQPTGGRQEEILAQNYDDDDASSAEKEAGLNLQKGKTKITHALIWIFNTKQWNPKTTKWKRNWLRMMMMMPGLLRRKQVWTKIARLNSQHNQQNPQTARRKRNWLRRMRTMRKRKCSRWRLQWPPRRKQVWICRKGKLKNTQIWILNTKHLNPQTEQRKRNWLRRMRTVRKRKCSKWRLLWLPRRKQVWTCRKGKL